MCNSRYPFPLQHSEECITGNPLKGLDVSHVSRDITTGGGGGGKIHRCRQELTLHSRSSTIRFIHTLRV